MINSIRDAASPKRLREFRVDIAVRGALDFDGLDFVGGSPRDTLKAAFKAGLIDDDVWMEMLTVRNTLTHDYDGTVLSRYCDTIIRDYIPEMETFCRKAEEIGDLQEDL